MPGEMDILPVGKELGIPVEVHVFEVLEDPFTIDPRAARAAAVDPQIVSQWSYVMGLLPPRILDEQQPSTTIRFFHVQNCIVMVANQTETGLLGLGKGASPNGQKHIPVMESLEQVLPQLLTGHHIVMQEDLFGNPSGQDPYIGPRVTSGKVVSATYFEVCFFHQRRPNEGWVVSVDHVQASSRIFGAGEPFINHHLS